MARVEMMERFTERRTLNIERPTSNNWGVALLALFLLAGGARADDVADLSSAPKLPPYKWFASTDPKHQNADYILLQPGETKRVPLSSGRLLRLWSTASEPDKITLVLLNGWRNFDLLGNGKTKFGELYKKAFTFYPTQSTPSLARALGSSAVLMATNHSQKGNKWFYQVTIRDNAKPRDKTPSPENGSEKPPKFDADSLDEVLRKTAQNGLEKFHLPANLKSPFKLCSAAGSARSKKGQPIPILKVQGEGAFVGLVLDIRPAPDTTRRTFAFLEGNEILIADGKKYEGTGTEDFFNSAWYFPDKEFSRTYHGVTLKTQDPPRVTAYRWMIPDAVPFKKNFEFQFEHGNGNNSDDLEYRWVAFWYQKPPFDYEIKDELKGGAQAGSTPSANATNAETGSATIWIFAALGGAVLVLVLALALKKRSTDG
jgi:hypothetical protein